MSEILNRKSVKYSIRGIVWVGMTLGGLWVTQQTIVCAWATLGS